ncbi:putative acyl-activating enzyme 18, partial [Quercus suber]
GGPENLFTFVVSKKGSSIEPDKLKILSSRIIQRNLNPLFKKSNQLSVQTLRYYYRRLKKGSSIEPDKLKILFSRTIQRNLNPLFKVNYVKIVSEFPRTTSNKLLRRIFEGPNEA